MAATVQSVMPEKKVAWFGEQLPKSKPSSKTFQDYYQKSTAVFITYQ
jgi:hypothetical protein